VPVDQREGRNVAVTGRQLNTEWFPERGQGRRGGGGERPARADALSVRIEDRGCVGAGIGGDLRQHDARRQLLLQLEEQRRIQRTGLVARRVKGRDDQVAACGGAAVKCVALLVLKAEWRHRHELAGQLAQAKIHLVVAGVCGARQETSPLETEEDRLDLPCCHHDRQSRLVVADTHAVVRADRHRQRQQLALVWRGRDCARNLAECGPSRLAVQLEGRRRDRPCRLSGSDDQHSACRRLQPGQHDQHRPNHQCSDERASPEIPRPGDD
jgi:hypothetical protein